MMLSIDTTQRERKITVGALKKSLAHIHITIGHDNILL